MPDSQPDYRPDPPSGAPTRGGDGMPTCPLCNTRGDVVRTPRSEPIADRCPFTCHNCWTVFTGSDQEWQSTREDRAAYASVRARLARAEEQTP